MAIWLQASQTFGGPVVAHVYNVATYDLKQGQYPGEGGLGPADPPTMMERVPSMAPASPPETGPIQHLGPTLTQALAAMVHGGGGGGDGAHPRSGIRRVPYRVCRLGPGRSAPHSGCQDATITKTASACQATSAGLEQARIPAARSGVPWRPGSARARTAVPPPFEVEGHQAAHDA